MTSTYVSMCWSEQVVAIGMCSPDQIICWEEFVGNTMTQYSPEGELLFLHANLSPKWNLEVPGDFKAYMRR